MLNAGIPPPSPRTDADLARVSPEVTSLDLGGAAISNAGLSALRRLPLLESVNLAWTPVTDDGVAVLAACPRLRHVDLLGTSTGDGAIRALAGKVELCDFRSGNDVTDEGLARLHDLPAFMQWRGGPSEMALLSHDARPNYLLLRGSFTDQGLAALSDLQGLFALNLDSVRVSVTGAGLAPLAALPHLEWLGFDATDASMPHIAALPHLRFLLCQDTKATDDGFVALSQCSTLEYLWGRRCHNLRRRGFTALSTLPALRALSVSCLNVDDEGLAVLPDFPALRELMPMDVPDDGYRHVGRCTRLESLVLMYCRETTDAATAHLAGLSALRKYFASYNRITDRTPEILSGLPSLEDVTFDSCAGLTNTGVATLARLPRLKRVALSGMAGVTAAVIDEFPQGVVQYES
jgi:hypothetical protein